MAKLLECSVFFNLSLLVAFALAPCSHGVNQTHSQPSSLEPISSDVHYHGGGILTGKSSINIYVIWYGDFHKKDRYPITDFFASFTPAGPVSHEAPTVSKWWKTILSYKDKNGNSVPRTVRLTKQLGDIKYSLGKNIKRGHIANYIKNKIEKKLLPIDSTGIYLFLTSKDVAVERFCMGSCGYHSNVAVTSKGRVVYAHVGNPLSQCPGLCSWPYAIPPYGPTGPALVAPNGVGADGMIINIATVLAGAATNPYMTGYYQGDVLAPLEAVTACQGIFGQGAYPGFPGNLMVDNSTKASYNAYGTSKRKFLLPAIWDLNSRNCKVIT